MDACRCRERALEGADALMLEERTGELEANWLVPHKNARPRTASGRVQLVCTESSLNCFDVQSQREATHLAADVDFGVEGVVVVVSEKLAYPVNSIQYEE